MAKEKNFTVNEELAKALIGNTIVTVDMVTQSITLSNGTKIQFSNESDCCSWIDVRRLSTVENIITDVKLIDTDSGEGPYKAKLQVIAGDEKINVVTADADASNGYYLHGWALGVHIDLNENSIGKE